MPGKTAGPSKFKYLLPVVLRNLPPMVHGERVLIRRTKGNLRRRACSSRELPEVLYLLELVTHRKDQTKV
jgi:hypothetical protein